MRFLRDKKGFTLIELVVAMVVFAILGGAVAGMIQAGLNSYSRISDDMYTETEARTVLSLVTVQLRQHDATGAIVVDEAQKVIGLRDDPSLPGGTIIWFSGNTLYTKEVTNVTVVPSLTEDNVNAVAQVYDFHISMGAAAGGTAYNYTVTVYYGSAGEKHLTQTITQRSAPEAP